MKLQHVAPFCLALALVGCVPPKPNPTLCELARNREAYAGRAVTVEGILFVSRHGSSVADPRCGWGIGIEWFEEDVPWMREFDAVAERSQMETMTVKVRATGIVKRASTPDFVGERPWRLRLAKADVLEAYPMSDGEMVSLRDRLTRASQEPFQSSPKQSQLSMACSAAIGAQAASVLARQCVQVSPATHPPCNAENFCEMIRSEIKRGCEYIGSDGRPNFCNE